MFKAFKAIEVFVRKACDLDDRVIGKELMMKAFNPENGLLTDPDEVPAERESLLQLFMGAIGRFKNPANHREVNIANPAEAVEMLQLAGLLMRLASARGTSRRGRES